MQTVPVDQLLFEVQDIIRSMPGPGDFGANPDPCIPWLGRASAPDVPSPGRERPTNAYLRPAICRCFSRVQATYELLWQRAAVV